VKWRGSGSRHSATADHIQLTAAAQFCSDQAEKTDYDFWHPRSYSDAREGVMTSAAQAAMARLALIILMLMVPLSARAEPGNPLIGRQTAMTVCTPCHQIGETRPDGPPSFVDIANMPSTTALSLKVFLQSNHKGMPNLIISNSDTDDLIAYILNLKQPSAR
jgi:mono/diheme cytochrome c family protein